MKGVVNVADYISRETCQKRLTDIKGTGYGWHISGLKIYDTPKELSKFSRPFENCIDKV